MSQQIYPETSPSLLAQQATLNTLTFSKQSLSSIQRQLSTSLSYPWHALSLDGIPSHKDYLLHQDRKRKMFFGQSVYSGRAERMMVSEISRSNPIVELINKADTSQLTLDQLLAMNNVDLDRAMSTLGLKMASLTHHFPELIEFNILDGEEFCDVGESL